MFPAAPHCFPLVREYSVSSSEAVLRDLNGAGGASIGLNHSADSRYNRCDPRGSPDTWGTTIYQLATDLGIHRTTVAAHLDRHQIPRHRERTAWESGTLEEAAELYASGLSLADVADQFGIDAQTVANRFRRAGVAVRPRCGRPSAPV